MLGIQADRPNYLKWCVNDSIASENCPKPHMETTTQNWYVIHKQNIDKLTLFSIRITI